MKRVLMFAPVETRSGYGDRARGLATAIINHPDKYKLEIFPTRWGETPWTALEKDNESHRAIKQRINPEPIPNPDIFIQLTIPNEFVRMGRYNIGMTAGIESDLCRPEWIEGANRMDMLIGSSNHTIEVIKASEYDKKDKNSKMDIGKLSLRTDLPTHVLFEGYDSNVYKKTANIDSTISDIFQDIPEKFCYLFVGHWLKGDLGEDRKDVGMLVRTFCDAFKNKPHRNRPALILKTSGGAHSIADRENIKQKVRSLISDMPAPPSIYLIHGELTEAEMNSLYNHPKVKAFVSLHRGEGYGRGLLEFGITGKPILASNWSGPTDFLHPDHTILLPGELQPLHKSVINDWFMPEAKWFRANYPYAIRFMQAVYDKYDFYKERAKGQKRHVENNFTLQKMEDKFIEILDTIDLPEQVQLKLPKLKKL